MIVQEMVSKVTPANPSVVVSHNIEQDYFAVNRRQAPDSSTKETKKHLKGIMKDVIHLLPTTALLSKLMAANPKVCEYLLYCAIFIISRLN